VSRTAARETVVAARRIIAGCAAVTSLALVLATAAAAGGLGMWFAVWSLKRVTSKQL
jgi:hypothetical protein